MRRGLSPQEAVNEALRRVTRSAPQSSGIQVAFIALSRSGEIGAGALQPGFQVALATGDGPDLLIDVQPWGK
jgi:N4-(beta-N-acetylglucosaminyl)-L-asparaginase